MKGRKVAGKSGSAVRALSIKSLEGTGNRRPGKNKKKKKKWQKWQKILFLFFVVLSAFLIGIIGAFLFQRGKVKYQLKVDKKYITYNEKEYKYRSGIVNILLLGIDKNIPLDEQEERRDNIGMSDAILLVSFDTKRDEVRVIAVPRDSVAELQTLTADGEYGPMEKSRICRQYAAGKTPEESNKLTSDAVSRLLYNVPIQKCCAINDNVLPVLNDAIGGVDVVVQEDLVNWEPSFVLGEEVHLEGQLAYRYVNVRNTERVDSSLLRTQRQKQYIKVFIQKAKSVVIKEPSIAFTLLKEFGQRQKSGDICTDITIDDMVYLLPEALQIDFSDDIIQVLPGESVMGENQHANYFLDSSAVLEIVINTFYEEV